MRRGADLPAVRAIGAWERAAREAMAAVDACRDDELELLRMPAGDLVMHAWDIRWGIARVGLADRLDAGAGANVDLIEPRGIGIAAMKCPGIYAARCDDAVTARLARQQLDVNMLTFGQRVSGFGVALLDDDHGRRTRTSG